MDPDFQYFPVKLTAEIVSISPSNFNVYDDKFYYSLPEKVYAYPATADLPIEHGWVSYSGHKLEELWSKIGNDNLIYRAIADVTLFARDSTANIVRPQIKPLTLE